MEDFGPIFWVAVTLAAMIYSSVSKAKKAAKKGSTAPQNTPAEAWPTPSMPIPQRQERQTPPSTDPQQEQYPGDEPLPAQIRQQIEPRPATSIQVSHPASSMSARTPKQPRKSAEHPAEASASPDKSQTEPQTPFYEDFDLRKAVIASEILKPKFDE